MMKTKSIGVIAAHAAVFLGLVVLVSPVQAAPKVRVGVLPLRGAGEGPVRAKVSNALKANGFQVVGSQQLESTANGLGVTLDGDAGFKAVAKELNIAAFVGGELTRKRAELVVRNGADASVLGEGAFDGPNPKKIASAVGAGFWRQLGSAVKQGRPPSGGKAKAAIVEDATPPDDEAEAPPPPAPEPKESKESKKKSAKRAAAEAPVAQDSEGESEKAEKAPAAKEAAPDEEEETSGSSGSGGLPALTLGAGARGLFRRLDWHQNVQMPLAPYALSPGPEAGLWLEAYPAAFVSDHFAANIGVFGSFSNGFGVTSTTTSGTRLTTKFRDFLGGVKVRLPMGVLAPYLSLAYGGQSFSLSGQTTASVPSVNYKLIRIGAGTRVAVGAVGSLDINAAYLLVTDPGSQPGEIRSAAYFPRATASGVDVGASFGYRLTKLFGVRAGVDFRQYGLDFKSRPTDARIVGGATDRYITAWGGLEVVLDGIGGGASGDDEEEEEAPAPAPKPKVKKGRKKAPPPPEQDEEAEK